MIKSTFNPQTNMVTFHNYSSTHQSLNYVFYDLDTNLVTHRGWISFNTNHYVDILFSFADSKITKKVLEKGFEVKLFDIETNKLIHQNQLGSDGKPNPSNYFYINHNGLAYGSWHSLFYEDEYKNDFIINDDDVVYDLGANVGVFTRWVIQKHKYGVIYCFEPTNELIDGLEQTFQNDNVKIFNKAISDSTKVDYFYIFKDSVSNTMVDLPNKNDNFVDKIKINCVNLEEFVNENNLQPPTFIKMDIEGEEYKVVKSWSKKFYDGIRCIILEFHRNLNGEIFEIIGHLANQGFELKLKDGNSLDEERGTIIFSKS